MPYLPTYVLSYDLTLLRRAFRLTQEARFQPPVPNSIRACSGHLLTSAMPTDSQLHGDYVPFISMCLIPGGFASCWAYINNQMQGGPGGIT